MDTIELNFQDFITVKEASEILGVCKGTVRKWEKDKKLQSIIHPVNGYRLFKIQDLNELLWKINTNDKQ